ncbi:precorrin-3B synthase [Phaeobacter gallaeciensis]|uniref:Precorrin-3B synthase n=1 Tax=Phaeobacter gallaeciensis TaxID=60890 RepID=A0AAC9ZB00_9RHOB|nr:precorrin-3B synthase [Phaeobacter gallaeciensis]AHD10411.1 precorrin-3B synthase [Phaeobacter gallaeciensis DSM 26640]ATE93674.1 precorrin-3B synthase [Phaeobacter gallaeciensis]ATE96505.1 precorrin-3B synthase [Phaeobacter gallaeciensis]ATF02338.1 precorrin-3B synthase [Phaeobacter gallaeciensis]ATF06718.1 precorrin-3B synthase [Phaeobacter gallaeciensis]
MTSARPTQPKVYGWCPGALRPMMSGDGLVVRVRAPLGRLTPEQARGLATLSQAHGSGLVDISARANLQLRGIREEAHAALIAGLRDLGLVDEDASAEARRNITLTPFWQVGDDGHRIAKALTQALRQAEDLELPGKFGFAIDCGTMPVLTDTAADIRIERDQSNADGLILRADGAPTGLAVSAKTAAQEALNLARWFLDQGGASEGRGRMHQLIARRSAPPAHVALPPSAKHIAPPRPGVTPFGLLVALEFGQMPARTLAKLADYGALRLTPWRMLLVEGIDSLPPLPGLILDATDPRLRVSACTGAPGCPQARAATRDLARDLAAAVPVGQHLHISGCAKGCAHPRPADLVLTATGTDRFDLICNGTAADHPLNTSLSAARLRAAPDLLTEGS